MAALFFSAAHKSSGKTTLTLGVCAALRARGLSIQPFKKGPDYIDPIWLGMAAGNPCYNLDFYVAGRQETIDDYCHRSQHADLSIIEGNKGLYDGLDLDGSNSNAALAKDLRAPVIMVVDARGTMRGIAPLLIGYQVFDREVNIAGVIANLTGGSRHESKLRAAVEEYTDIPFLGALGNHRELQLDERHLGLIPGYEDPAAHGRIDRIAEAVSNHIDLAGLQATASQAGIVEPAALPLPPSHEFRGLRIAIARDRAFGFYYPGDLDAFERAGAELVPFDTLADAELPEVDGLWIGGGFPERHADALAANQPLRASIRTAIENGMPTYAECGGLMYLSRQLHWQDQSHPMVGVLDADTRMHDKSQGRGYVRLRETDALWPLGNLLDETVRAHEFHYSTLEDLPQNNRFCWQVERGKGIDRQRDGVIRHNLLASYSHQRHTINNPWVRRFLQFVRDCKYRSRYPADAAGLNA